MPFSFANALTLSSDATEADIANMGSVTAGLDAGRAGAPAFCANALPAPRSGRIDRSRSADRTIRVWVCGSSTRTPIVADAPVSFQSDADVRRGGHRSEQQGLGEFTANHLKLPKT
jgi:hypothetical protein